MVNIQDQTTSGVAWNHRPRDAHTVRQRRARHAIMSLGQHIQSDDVEHNMPLPLDLTYIRTTWVLACPHVFWVAHTFEQHRAWNSIIALGNTDSRKMSGITSHHFPWTAYTVRQRGGVACYHLLWKTYTIGLRQAWHVITHGHTTSGEVCHHRPWTKHMVSQRQAWHAYMGLR